NPVLGDFFRCRYDCKNDIQEFFIAEQVSHHSLISAFFYVSPTKKASIIGGLQLMSRFLGNS
ncbi:hypothetical protein EI94DRAFT_1420963, partial [Lactarius quietus]